MNEVTTWTLVVAAIVAYLALKRLTLISAEKARDLIKQGALVIDVRSPREFEQRRLPGVVNIPLGALPREIVRIEPNKERTLLLHCLSGGRSGLARASLRRMGYRNVYNLGSLARAKTILGA